MAKGSVITKELFQAVKQLQLIHKDHTAEQLAPMVCREETVIRRIMKCGTWEEYCEFKKAKAEKERARAEKRKLQAEEPKAEEQVEGQMEMDLRPAEEKPAEQTEQADRTKMMRFQAHMTEEITKKMDECTVQLLTKLDRLNDTMSMILRAIRKE